MLKNLISMTAESPCVGHCTTVLGDEVCRSCLRTFDEITSWPTITDEQRIAINQRVARLALTTSPLITHRN
ncbi:MAG: DUF1289 domain-containing protein [Gallionella sp.]